MTHSGAPGGGDGAQGEFEELTDEQFEALRAQYERQEQDMLAAMSPGQVGAGGAEGDWGQDREEGYDKADGGKGRPDSVLFGVDKPSKTAPKEKDIWSGRKQEGVV